MLSNEMLNSSIVNVLISLFLDLNLEWNATILRQFQSAQTEFDNCGCSWFFDFHYNCTVPPIPIVTRVPVVIEICNKFVITDGVVRRLSSLDNAYWVDETSRSATGFHASQVLASNYWGVYMHFTDGVVREIEVVDWNGNEINAAALLHEIAKGERMYRVADNTIVAELAAKPLERRRKTRMDSKAKN